MEFSTIVIPTLMSPVNVAYWEIITMAAMGDSSLCLALLTVTKALFTRSLWLGELESVGLCLINHSNRSFS